MSYNDTKPSDPPRRILIVRLGAMGDVIHALPVAARLKRAFPNARIAWAVEPLWEPLLKGNPFVDEVILAPISAWRKRPASPVAWSAARALRRRLRAVGFDAAIDLQGLIKSAILAHLSGASRVYGFARGQLREPLAGVFYTHRAGAAGGHVVEKNLALAAALGAASGPMEFPLPQGTPQPDLPQGEFVLTSPVAGWKAKQWPPQYYAQLAALLAEQTGMVLVIDCAPADRAYCEQIRRLAPPGSCQLHVSTIEGLIAATRRARAVVGIDSGPLHLAAALGVAGVAVFGQTDPARNGPYGDTFTVIRDRDARTSYKREDEIATSMAAIGPELVWQALEPRLASQTSSVVGGSR
jgi:heptosyltransferase-1